ncbi:chemotaxis protein CheY, partial [Candidatus Magnetomorum sp. HK-1]
MTLNLDSKAIILVVDDEPINLQIMIGILKTKAYTVKTAINGKRALKSLEKSLPDLILLDIEMPEMNGFEFCSILKKDPKTEHIPIIFISALSEVFDKVKAFNLGAVDY